MASNLLLTSYESRRIFNWSSFLVLPKQFVCHNAHLDNSFSTMIMVTDFFSSTKFHHKMKHFSICRIQFRSVICCHLVFKFTAEEEASTWDFYFTCRPACKIRSMKPDQLIRMRRNCQSSKMAISRRTKWIEHSTIWNSSSRKIIGANDVNIVNFATCYVLFYNV